MYENKLNFRIWDHLVELFDHSLNSLKSYLKTFIGSIEKLHLRIRSSDSEHPYVNHQICDTNLTTYSNLLIY